jgi:hypothetical protein
MYLSVAVSNFNLLSPYHRILAANHSDNLSQVQGQYRWKSAQAFQIYRQECINVEISSFSFLGSAAFGCWHRASRNGFVE